MTDPTRILLTGSTGQLGRRLISALAPLGLVIAPDREHLNLASLGRIRAAISEISPALIINAAAYTAVDRAEDESAAAHRINAEAPGVLAQAATALDCPIIHFSTDYVFDGSAFAPYPPDAPTNPINAYGRSKRDGEVAIASAGARSLIIRTAWVNDTTGRNFLRAILNQAEQGKPLRVVNDQFGSPTWAHDLAVGAAAIARQLLEDASAPTGIYHLTGTGICTWYDFACAILEHADLQTKPSITPVPSSEFPTKARRPRYSALDCTSAARDFGVTLPHWRDAVERAMTSG